MRVKASRIVRSAPLSRNVFKSKMAPKIMKSNCAVMSSPFTEPAAICGPGTFHTSAASAMHVR